MINTWYTSDRGSTNDGVSREKVTEDKGQIIGEEDE